MLLIGHTGALDNGLAKTPPMGFNGYFAHVGGEEGLGAVADFLVSSGLRESGYVYVNTDEGWEEKSRDEDGRLQWSSSEYPSGLPTFIDHLHKQGLKYGIYGAASGVTCGENPGQLYYEEVDAQTYASWGVDFLKSDNCASYALDSSVRFAAMRDALKRAGRPLLLSIEPFSITPDPAQSVKVSNMARIGKDCGSYNCALLRADISDKWSPLAQPGYWNDPDTIELSNDLGSKNRVWFGLWVIMKAPLLLSAKLAELKPEVMAVANNTEAIAVNQDKVGVQARKLSIKGQPVPWLVGLDDCEARAHSYSRNFVKQQTQDRRAWTLEKVEAISSDKHFNGPATGIPASRRCGSCCGASDTTSALCQNTTEDGRLSVTQAEMESRCLADDTCAGFALNTEEGGYYRPLLHVDQVDVSDSKWQYWSKASSPPTGDSYLIRSSATARCLAAEGSRVVLLPCAQASAEQRWIFGKGVTTVSSVVNEFTGSALAMTNETLYAQTFGKDAFPTSAASYGHSGLTLVTPTDQHGCTHRDCENYDHTQMWYYDVEEGMLRQSTFIASINHGDDGDHYTLTPRVPTYRHHCLAHVLSEANAGTESGATEFWGGPLSDGEFVIGLVNRGNDAAEITADLELLETAKGSYEIRNLWEHSDDGVVDGSFSRTIPGNDMGLYRLTPSTQTEFAV